MEKETQRVMLRKAVESPLAGSVIAVFVDDVADQSGNLWSYMHVGQHSAASKEYVVQDTLNTDSGCGDCGCMLDELRSIGYEDLEVVNDLSEVGHRAKCLYCDSDNEPAHFICANCGDGMCQDCYDAGKEHDLIYQDPKGSADAEGDYLLLEDIFGDTYGCAKCVEKARKMGRNMEDEYGDS